MATRSRSVPRKRPTQERSRETVQRILDAAARLFDRRGYAATTTNHVAEAAGISVGSLYQYFPNKDALLFALGERHLVEASGVFAARAEQARREEPALSELVDLFIEAMTEVHAQNPRLHRLLSEEVPRTPELAKVLDGVEAAVTAEVEFHLRRLGVGGPHPHRRAVLVVQMTEAVAHRAVLDASEAEESDEYLAELRRLMLAALTPISEP